MNALWQMTLRNLKIFLKDKANIFFSLLCPLIVLALYVLFWATYRRTGSSRRLPKRAWPAPKAPYRPFATA